MIQLLRFSNPVRHDSTIDAWFKSHSRELAPIAHHWFSVMRNCGDDVRELMHDGCPVVCVEDAPFAYVNIFTAHVNVGFFLGAYLKDSRSLLQGTGKRMRHVKLRPDMESDGAAINALIEAAYSDIKERLKAGQ